MNECAIFVIEAQAVWVALGGLLGLYLLALVLLIVVRR